MTVYFDKRAFEEKEKEEQEELEAEEKKEAAKVVVVGVLSLLVKPLVIMLLWNWLVPGIFGLATIGYLKAFGLFMISRIIFDKND